MYKRILLAYDGSQPGQKALIDCDESGRATAIEPVRVSYP